MGFGTCDMVTERGNHQRRESSTFSESRRRFIKTIGAGAAVTSFAGCTGDNGGDGENVKIGFIGPSELPLGAAGERAAQLAVDEINEDSGINDQTVELVTADSGGIPSTAVQEARRMIQRENIDVLMGTYVSEVANSLTDVTAENNVPFFITGAASPGTLQDTVGENYEKYKNIFRVGTVNSDYEARELVNYAEYLADEHGWTDFAFTPEDAAWTDPFQEILPSGLEERGLNVVVEESLSTDLSDWTPILDEIESSGAQVMIKTLASLAGPSLLTNWQESEYPFAQEGNHVVSAFYEFWDDTGGACEYEGVGDPGGAGVIPITEKSIPFTERYNDQYDSRPTMPTFCGAQAYDSVYVYKNIVEQAGTSDASNEMDTIVDTALETDYTGTTGQIQFHDPDHEYPHDVKWGTDLVPYVITQWQSDSEGNPEKVGVFPEEHATGTHQMPDWM
jgi:branched-chain amino acid transport system substrate-binding protein